MCYAILEYCTISQSSGCRMIDVITCNPPRPLQVPVDWDYWEGLGSAELFVLPVLIGKGCR